MNEDKIMRCKRNIANRLTKRKCYVVYTYYNYDKNARIWYVIDDNGGSFAMNLAERFKIFNQLGSDKK